MTEPSPDEIRDVIIAWAHAEGYLASQSPAEHGKPWSVVFSEDGAVDLNFIREPTVSRTAHTRDYAEVLVWALAVVSKLTADVGACSWCGGDVMVDSGGFTPWDEPIDVRCAACVKKPGREVIDAAWLVCMAIPTCRGHGVDAWGVGDHLLAFADRWQGDGEPLGFAVAHWLAGVGEWRRAALDVVLAATLPCPKCEGVGAVTPSRIGSAVEGADGSVAYSITEWVPAHTNTPTIMRVRCDRCEGHGRVAHQTD